LIRIVGSEVQLYGDEWIKYVEDNVSASVKILHFNKEGEDTFYVTGYNENGSEGSGCDVGRRFVKCLVRRKNERQVPLQCLYILHSVNFHVIIKLKLNMNYLNINYK
jgi:hypothetical protein